MKYKKYGKTKENENPGKSRSANRAISPNISTNHGRVEAISEDSEK